MRVARAAQRRPILFEHGFQYLQARSDRELEQLGARVDEQIDQREMTGRFNSGGAGDRARPLNGGSLLAGFRPGLVTTRFTRAVRSRRSQISTATGTSLRMHWLLVTGYWLLVTGYWLLVTGYWLLATGYWLLAFTAFRISSANTGTAGS
jgi:hypothetical protein